MKTLPMMLLAALALAPTTNAGQTADGRLSAAEQAALVQTLEQTRTDVLALAAGLTDEQWSTKPAPDRWSVAEIVEHLALVERDRQSFVKELLTKPAHADWKTATQQTQAVMEAAIPDRSNKVQAPAPVQPKSKMERAETLRKFTEARADTIAMAQSGKPFQAHVDMASPLGPMNAAQWLEFNALHTMRHLKQAEEALGQL